MKEPNKIDVASYIEIIKVDGEEIRKATRDDGNVNNSANLLAFKNHKISQNQKEVDSNVPTIVDYGIKYKVSGYSPPQQTEQVLLFGNIKNHYTDELAKQAYGEQTVLQNCPTGINIYYDGENGTELVHGWIRYNVSRIGTNTDIDNIIYDQRIKMRSYETNVINNPVIEQYYSNNLYTDQPFPFDQELNSKIKQHLDNLQITIKDNDNIYLYFMVNNTTNSRAYIDIVCGSTQSTIELKPLSEIEVNTSGIASDLTKISITVRTNHTLPEYVELYDFKLCLEKQGAELSQQCNGIDISFNGNFNSGLIGWAKTGYVVQDAQQIVLSSLCGGYTENPTISQTHFAGSGITPIGTELYEEDRLKVIVNLFNDSIVQSDITISINGNSQSFVVRPQETRILSHQAVLQSTTATSTITVKTYPKPAIDSDIGIILPIKQNYSYKYGIFTKKIDRILTGNVDAAVWGKNGSYLYMCTYVEFSTYNTIVINRVLIDENLSANQESFCQFNIPFNSSIISIGRLNDQYIYILKKINSKVFIDWYDVNTKALHKSLELSTSNNLRNGLHDALSICCCLDENGYRLLIGCRSTNAAYDSNILFDYIYSYALNDDSMQLLNMALSDFILNISVDQDTSNILASYRGRKPSNYKYIDEVNDYESQYYKSGQVIKSFTPDGEFSYGTEIYRNDRPIDTIDNNIVAQNPPYNLSPMLGFTQFAISNRKFVLWAKNEPAIKNSIGKVAGNDTEYYDQYGYNKNYHVYCVEYSGFLPSIIGKATPAFSIHRPYPVANSNQPLVIW